jgi:hypothetical protein
MPRRAVHILRERSARCEARRRQRGVGREALTWSTVHNLRGAGCRGSAATDHETSTGRFRTTPPGFSSTWHGDCGSGERSSTTAVGAGSAGRRALRRVGADVRRSDQPRGERVMMDVVSAAREAIGPLDTGGSRPSPDGSSVWPAGPRWQSNEGSLRAFVRKTGPAGKTPSSPISGLTSCPSPREGRRSSSLQCGDLSSARAFVRVPVVAS